MAHMPIEQARKALYDFDFQTIFLKMLGWDFHFHQLPIEVENQQFLFSAIAHKRGFAVYKSEPLTQPDLPDYQTRAKLESQLARHAHEHLIIFVDQNRTRQVWQWVRREAGQPIVRREYRYDKGQPGDSLLQRLQQIAIALEEEEDLTLVTVSGRVQAAFDADRVTKRFYERFKKEREDFAKTIQGIDLESKRGWYASVLLNRLMFVYFIQKKGFLNGDHNYLRNKLQECRARFGHDKFYSFYRTFLLRLFHQGLAQPRDAWPADLNELLGVIPYIDGGIFQQHPIEQEYTEINVPDAAFERLFDFFDVYRWHLDERPLRKDNEINPDVLGYIFERYINQKELGAYYTKEDITEYIGRSTIVPRLFDMAKEQCPVAFEPEGPVWSLLRQNPDRYIFEPLRRGVVSEDGTVIPESELPDFVQVGMRDPKARMFDERYNLGQAVLHDKNGNNLCLPTETWREYVERRTRCLELREKLVRGEVHDVNDLITYNLDIRQLAEDVLTTCGPDLLMAFWRSLERITILDPTVGSGAFLLAALNILEPLYDAALDHKEAIVGETAMTSPGAMNDPTRARPIPQAEYGTFRETLARVSKHPNRRYFILKTIVVNNLFGVDIVPEAAEICKLRLYLKLIAQVDRPEEIEPLPDVDFSIRCGNSLVGYTSIKHRERMWGRDNRLKFEKDHERLEQQLREYSVMLYWFHRGQLGEQVPRCITKTNLVHAHSELVPYLDEDIWRLYRTQCKVPLSTKLEEFRRSHIPFHWFAEFPRAMAAGGFDVVIGNPPYVEYDTNRVPYSLVGYETTSCGNLYAYVVERSSALARADSRTGLIVPHSAFCTDRMEPLLRLVVGDDHETWISTYCIRPSKLFVGADQRLAIVIQSGLRGDPKAFATKYNRWYSEARPVLFDTVQYGRTARISRPATLPKTGHHLAAGVLRKLRDTPRGIPLSRFGVATVCYHNAPRYWIRAMTFVPYFWNERDGEHQSSQVKGVHLLDCSDAGVVAALLNSSLFYWWFILMSDCRHLNAREIQSFPAGLNRMQDDIRSELCQLTAELMKDYRKHARRKTCTYKATGRVEYDEFYPGKSKHILDRIDEVLARHYGFTDEELDFIINYDIKFRMGNDALEEG